MAGPLNGLGTAQTIPLSNTFQPGQGAENRKASEEDKTKRAQAQDFSTQSSQNRKDDVLRARQVSEVREARENDERRGSLVDITV